MYKDDVISSDFFCWPAIPMSRIAVAAILAGLRGGITLQPNECINTENIGLK